MPAYWWQCDKCERESSFESVVNSRGLPHYIRDVLIPSGWNQNLLVRPCGSCEGGHAYITYEFPRSDREIVRVIHIVGLGDENEDYIPMMWETHFAPYEAETCFDFKYIRGRSAFGLNKPAVLSKSELQELFSLYERSTGNNILND